MTPELGSIRPGSMWCWNPLNLEEYLMVSVVKTEKKDDGVWWVQTRYIRIVDGKVRLQQNWNELSRFIEVCVLVQPAPDNL
jgi:hypothetical protein